MDNATVCVCSVTYLLTSVAFDVVASSAIDFNLMMNNAMSQCCISTTNLPNFITTSTYVQAWNRFIHIKIAKILIFSKH